MLSPVRGKINNRQRRQQIGKIKIGKRYRKSCGDLSELKISIAEIGLLHPIVIASDHSLIAGQRRLLACRELGWKEIPATVIDLEDIFRGQVDENVVRKDFLPTEMVAIGREIEKHERQAAKKRQALAGPKKGKGKKTGSGNLPEPVGDSRDKVAACLGVSGKTYEKAKAVVEYGDTKLTEQMDATGKVEAAYKQMNDDKKKAERRKAQKAKTKTMPKSQTPIIVGDFYEKSDQVTDGSLSLIFTDPPYDRKAADMFDHLASFAEAKLAEGGSLIAYIAHINIREALHSFDAKLRYWWMICCLHSGKKPLMTQYGIRVGWKPVLWYVKGTRGDRQEIVTDVMSGGQEKSEHEWQQSESEASYWIDKLCPRDGVVCDPFLGSGTTAVAAKKLKRKWIAFEIEPETAEAAQIRINT